jgi:CRP-like cAMP-binding protein
MTQTNISDSELRAHSLFAGLSDEQLTRVKEGIRLLKLAVGDHLFSQGQLADRFFLLRAGEVKLYRLSLTGNEKVIEIVQPGQVFAEALMFMDAPLYPVNAQALTVVEIYAINNKQFLNILRDSIDTCFRVMADISLRLHQLLNEIDALTLQNATLRLVNFLLSQVPGDAGNTADVALPAAKNIIASRLSIQPETLSRILHNLGKQELISVKGLNVQIHDVQGLRDCYYTSPFELR